MCKKSACLSFAIIIVSVLAVASTSLVYEDGYAKKKHNKEGGNGEIPNNIIQETPQTPSGSKAGKAYFLQSTDMPANSPVYIVSTSMNKDIGGFIHIAGEVNNNGTQAVSLVDVISSFYDRNNLLLTSIEAYAIPYTLEPGQSAPFSLDVGPPEAPSEEIDHVKYHLTWTSPSNVR